MPRCETCGHEIRQGHPGQDEPAVAHLRFVRVCDPCAASGLLPLHLQNHRLWNGGERRDLMLRPAIGCVRCGRTKPSSPQSKVRQTKRRHANR